MNSAQLALIRDLLTAADEVGIPLWLESGWAIDARLDRITREHGDVDIAVPQERLAAFMELLEPFEPRGFEATEYGFTVSVDGVLLDCDRAVLIEGDYELAGFPPGSCPWDKQGTIQGFAVRCTSWEAILWEYFYYVAEVPRERWRPHDEGSYELVRSRIGEPKVSELRRMFDEARS